MNPLWDYFWPCLAIGLLVGALAGALAFRRRSRRNKAIAIGLVTALALTFVWHGPMGGADRFAFAVEGAIQRALVHYEMTQVRGHLHHGPLTRRVSLSGPADDFQRSELVRLINQMPGVSDTSWSASGGGIPLIVQGLAIALLGFLSGLLLAYLVELRRRYNAQWNW
jgi:hypothetical protein